MSQQSAEQELALRKIRDEIDAIDRQLHQLLNQRARCAQAVAEVKSQFQQERVVYYRPEREAQVLRKVMERNEGPIADTEVARLFREVMSVCLALEEPLRVLFPGRPGSGAHQAAMKHFGQSANFVAVDSTGQIFSSVASGDAHYAVLPLEDPENLVSEQAADTLEALAAYHLAPCGEVSVLGARYLVIGDQQVGPSGEDKTALLLELSGPVSQLTPLFDQVGVAPVSQVDMSLDGGSRLYVEFAGHSADQSIIRLVKAIEQQVANSQVVNAKLLGSFPKAVL